jgi:hypothetical protein
MAQVLTYMLKHKSDEKVADEPLVSYSLTKVLETLFLL